MRESGTLLPCVQLSFNTLHDATANGFAEYSIAAICNACHVGGLEPAATS